MRKEVLKKTTAMTLALMLAVPAVATAPDSVAAKKTPKMGIKSMTILADSTNDSLYIDANGAKIKKTTWSTSNKSVVDITKKSKTGVTLKAAKVGGKSAKITAKVKYKAGKKTKTKKLTSTVKVEWLKIDTIGDYMDADDGTTGITVFFGEQIPSNSVAFDTKFDEGDSYDGFWDWDKSAQKVVEVTDAASGSAVEFERALYSTSRGGRLSIRFGREIIEKTTYKVVVKGFEGMEKDTLEGEVTIEPKKITFTQVGYRYPAVEKNQKPYTALTLSTDVPLNVYAEYQETSNPLLVVLDEDGKELKVETIVVATNKVEGDQLIIDVKGGTECKKFTVEFADIFLPYFANPGVCYLEKGIVVVDKVDPNWK